MANGTHFEFLLAGLCDSSGNPLSGGKVYTYQPGTTTPKATYQDRAQATPHQNPIVLDSSGRNLVFGLGGYKFVITDANDNTIATWDNVYEYIGDPNAIPLSDWNLGGSIAIYGAAYTGSYRTTLINNGTVQDGTVHWAGTSSGSANVQTCNLTPTPTTLGLGGFLFRFKAGFANTADSPTMNVNGTGAKTMLRPNGTALRKGDLIANAIYEAIYDGTSLIILNPTPTWQTWTPTQTCSGSMTITGITNREHNYIIHLDGTVEFEATADFTLGGTQSASIYVSLPIAAVAHHTNSAFICSADENGAAVANGGRWKVDATPQIVVFKRGAANWTLGAAASYSIKGSFRLG